MTEQLRKVGTSPIINLNFNFGCDLKCKKDHLCRSRSSSDINTRKTLSSVSVAVPKYSSRKFFEKEPSRQKTLYLPSSDYDVYSKSPPLKFSKRACDLQGIPIIPEIPMDSDDDDIANIPLPPPKNNPKLPAGYGFEQELLNLFEGEPVQMHRYDLTGSRSPLVRIISGSSSGSQVQIISGSSFSPRKLNLSDNSPSPDNTFEKEPSSPSTNFIINSKSPPPYLNDLANYNSSSGPKDREIIREDFEYIDYPHGQHASPRSVALEQQNQQIRTLSDRNTDRMIKEIKEHLEEIEENEKSGFIQSVKNYQAKRREELSKSI